MAKPTISQSNHEVAISPVAANARSRVVGPSTLVLVSALSIELAPAMLKLTSSASDQPWSPSIPA